LCGEPGPNAAAYVEAVRSFADTVVEQGRDKYGQDNTPLFVDGLHVDSLEPARWMGRGQTWVLSNFASQQPLFRLLDGLTELTGEPRYRRAAEAAARHAMEHLRAPNGLLYWGGHLAWDLAGERPVGQGSNVHELKGHQPYYRLMWRVKPDATRKLLETVWASHVLDWSSLDYNRHANTDKLCVPQWGHRFDEDLVVPFPTRGSNLSFVNVTPPLVHAGTMLAVLDDSPEALTWTRRLLYRWQQGKHPKTGLCGGQLSFREHDRAQDALGHVHPEINEAKIVASYHQMSRYHHLPLVQMQAAETLIAAGGEPAEVGRELVRWASEDLKVYANHSYDPKTGAFVALTTDGTPIRWRESRTGYYVPSSFAPRKPDGTILWGYATAYRLTRDEALWHTARELAEKLGLGDLGRSDGGDRNLRFDTDCHDWQVIYSLLDLYEAVEDRALLRVACRIADNLLRWQTDAGLFPRPERAYARTGDEIPLAVLHLAATIEGKRSSLPKAVFDRRFFHCEYHGDLKEHQRKRADKRTYDHLVFYGNP
jgi:pectate lyase